MANKRRNWNEGTIFQLSKNKWRAQISHNNQRISKTVSTKPEALEWIRSMKAELEKGYDYQGSTTTLKDYLPLWLEQRRISLRPKTVHQYGKIIQNHILPVIGKEKLKDLRLLQIEQFYSRLIENGMGARTVRVVHNILHSALAKAVKYGLVIFNATQGANLPRYSHEEMTVLDSYQVTQFLIAARGTPNYTIFYLAITTGMRMGELFGLKWADIQWNVGVLHVQRQNQYVPGHGYNFIEPKTRAGRRSIKLGMGAIELLHQYKEEQEMLKQCIGAGWHDLDLVFPNTVGKASDGSNLREEFKKVLNIAGLPRMRFHDLRHTAASLLLNNNVPVIIVSNMLGHSKPSVTLDIYAHVFHDMQGEAANVMDRLVTPIPVEIPGIKQSIPIQRQN